MDELLRLFGRAVASHPWLTLAFVPVAAILVAAIVRPLTASKDRNKYPPGPKRVPLLGNALQMPTVRPWETYSKWAKDFNTEVLYLNVLGFPIIVLDSAKAARELLEKRSSIYSDRPSFPFFDLMGWSWAIQFIGYGEKFRRHRRPLHTYLSQPNLRDYWPIQHNEVRHLLRDLLSSPECFLEHSKHAAAGMAMTMLYGLPRGPARTSLIHIAEEATDSLVAAGNFGDHFVDVLPIMKHIPEWVPGAGFQKQAREWRILCERMVNAPFEDVKQRIAAGDLKPCLVARLLEIQAGGQDPDMTDYMIKSTAGVIYLGSADTSLSAIQTFFLAMTLYPEVQKRAQAEIDAVCGGNRFPTLSDRCAMPYLECILWELFRWNPTTPLGVPHRVSEDDVYENHFIPKGSTVMVNLWSIFHDPAVYPDPFRFNPGRYLRSNGSIDCSVLDPRTLAFGFGRRTCPGRIIGDSAIWAIVTGVLATFEIASGYDSHGRKIIPSTEYTTGLVSRPVPFACSITPRGDSAMRLISSSPEEAC